MKITKAILLAAVMMAAPAMASTDCGSTLSRLSAGVMKDTMMMACIAENAKTAKAATSIGNTIANADMDEVASIATKYATAAGIMAREVGMATNEFIKTDAGKIATIAIVWTIFGEDLKGIIFAPLISLFLFFVGRSAMRKIIGGSWDTVTVVKWYRKEPIQSKVWTPTSWYNQSESQAGWSVTIALATGITICIILINGLL